MMDAFLELAGLYVIAPLPLWSPFHEAAGDVAQPESHPSLDQTDVVEVTAAGEGLTQFGFAAESDPKLLELPSSDSQHLAVHFIRGVDKITLAVVENALCVMFETANADGAGDDDTQPVGTFGAFPVRPGVDDSIGVAMKRVAGWFIEAGGDALAPQPLPVADLCR